jgi:hypothetical protein
VNAIIYFLAAATTAATPTPTGTKDRVVQVAFVPGTPTPADLAVSLAGSAATSLKLATWQLSDTRLSTALSLASSRGVAVQVCLDFTAGTNSEQQQISRALKASGGTVWNTPIPHQIADNFLLADGNYELTGNYYYSPTAVQPGSYSIAISGTNAPAAAATTFAALVSSGTKQAVAPQPPCRPPECPTGVSPILPPAPTPGPTPSPPQTALPQPLGRMTWSGTSRPLPQRLHWLWRPRRRSSSWRR